MPTLGALLLAAAPATADARPLPAPPKPVVVPDVRHVVAARMRAQALHHLAAERHRKAVARWHRRQAARAAAAQAAAQASSFASAMTCIGLHEEGGANSVAGYFGFIYPPSSYVAPGPELAATYGDSWLAIPRPEQLRVAFSLYRQYGWSPWSTAAACGLG